MPQVISVVPTPTAASCPIGDHIALRVGDFADVDHIGGAGGLRQRAAVDEIAVRKMRIPVEIVVDGVVDASSVLAAEAEVAGRVEEQVEGYRLDLRTLYEKLRPWFESAPILRTGANFSPLTGSHKP